MTLASRFVARFRQYRTECTMLAAALRSLAVNLEYMDGLGLPASSRVVVVDSMREAVLLRLLGGLGIVGLCTVRLVTRAEQLIAISEASHSCGCPVILTLRVCSRHYQTVAHLRRRSNIIVL